jgi:hypothetical protein
MDPIMYRNSWDAFSVGRFGPICPEGAKQNSPGQSEVAVRHERRPGKVKPANIEALKGRNKLESCFAPSGLWSFFGTKTQGVACGYRRGALPWAFMFGPFGAELGHHEASKPTRFGFRFILSKCRVRNPGARFLPSGPVSS